MWAIYSFTNAGAVWVSNNAPAANWHAVASSADGSKLVATSQGRIYTSTNAGAAWVSNNVPTFDWAAVASSADGNKLVAVSSDPIFFSKMAIYTTTNAGTVWVSNNVPNRSWTSVASSADGNKLVAVENYSGRIYSSTNAGVSWVQDNVASLAWSAVISSADGNRLAAVGGRGSIYVSYSTPTPQLNITPATGGARVSWLIPSLRFTLQQSAELAAAKWTDVTNAPVLNLTNLLKEVTVPLSGSATYFRLRSNP